MSAAPLSWSAVVEAAAQAGAPVVGATRLTDDLPAPIGLAAPARTLALLGYDGTPTLWRAFSAGPEAADGAPHPLDRWSKRIADALAERLGASALYPFGGPPYQPFFAWAQAADQVWPSPIGMLVGEGRGLWPSYRAALAFADALDIPAKPRAARPCETCARQPCRAACPVGAFGAADAAYQGYDVAACAAHLDTPEGADCRTLGCRARRACPVAPPPAPAQAAFHLAAFRAARRREADAARAPSAKET